MNMKNYKEILKLKEMLENANIPFKFKVLTEINHEGYQILYPTDGENRVCSVIEHTFSYGNDVDRLEIMGLLTSEELKYDDVVGFLSAEDVFKRIKNHFITNTVSQNNNNYEVKYNQLKDELAKSKDYIKLAKEIIKNLIDYYFYGDDVECPFGKARDFLKNN